MNAVLARASAVTPRLGIIARKPWVIALTLLIAYVIYGFASGSVAVYGGNLWAGVPWDWSHNIEVGTSGFYVNSQ